MYTKIQSNLMLAVAPAVGFAALNCIVGKLANRFSIETLGGVSVGQATALGILSGASSFVSESLPDSYQKIGFPKVVAYIGTAGLLAWAVHTQKIGSRLRMPVKTLVGFLAIDAAALFARRYFRAPQDPLAEQTQFYHGISSSSFSIRFLQNLVDKDIFTDKNWTEEIKKCAERAIPFKGPWDRDSQVNHLITQAAHRLRSMQSNTGQLKPSGRLFLLWYRLLKEVAHPFPSEILKIARSIWSQDPRSQDVIENKLGEQELKNALKDLEDALNWFVFITLEDLEDKQHNLLDRVKELKKVLDDRSVQGAQQFNEISELGESARIPPDQITKIIKAERFFFASALDRLEDLSLEHRSLKRFAVRLAIFKLWQNPDRGENKETLEEAEFKNHHMQALTGEDMAALDNHLARLKGMLKMSFYHESAAAAAAASPAAFSAAAASAAASADAADTGTLLARS